MQNQYEDVLKRASTRVCFSLLKENIPDSIQVLQSTYTKNLEEIITDDKAVFQQVQSYLQCYETQEVPVRFYEDSLLPLAKLYSLETAVSEAAQERVWLKSGGFLVIQQTEAFVCIDVNTGKFRKKRNSGNLSED